MKLDKSDITVIRRDRIVNMGYIHDHISDFTLPIIDLASGCYSFLRKDYYGFEKGGNSSMAMPVVIFCHRVIFQAINYNLYLNIRNHKISDWNLNWITGTIHYMV